jgi:hypothetical protein
VRTINYQQRILECARNSETAPNLEARIVWKRMEEFWRQRVTAPKTPVHTFKELSFIEHAPPQSRAQVRRAD